MTSEEHSAIAAFGYETGHLKRIARSGWLLAGVRNPESMAEHSVRVGVLAYCIAAQEGANRQARHPVGQAVGHDASRQSTGRTEPPRHPCDEPVEPRDHGRGFRRYRTRPASSLRFVEGTVLRNACAKRARVNAPSSRPRSRSAMS